MARAMMWALGVVLVACSGDGGEGSETTEHEGHGTEHEGHGGVAMDDFADAYFGAYCGMDCTGDSSAVCDGTFPTSTTTDTTMTCDYDPMVAADCVDVANWTCEASVKGSKDTYPTPPNSCWEICG